MRAAYYFQLALIVCSSFVLGLFLLPSDSTKALMFYYEKKYTSAYSIYKSLYQDNKTEVSVAIPLVWLHLKKGQEDEAVQVLEGYIRGHPSDVEGLQYLANLYKQTALYQKELEILEKLYVIAPTEEILRRQIKIHEYYKNSNQALMTLQRLIANHEPHEKDFVSLSYLAASKGKVPLAKQVLKLMFDHIPFDSLNKETILFSLDFYGDQKFGKEAKQVASQYLSQKKTTKEYIEIAFALENAGFYQEGLEILSLLPEQEKIKESVITAQIQLLLSSKQTSAAYSLFLKHYQNNSLPDSLYKEFFTIALENQKIETLQEFILSRDFEKIPENLTLRMIENSIQTDNGLIQLVNQAAEKNYLSKHPQIDLALIFSDEKITEEEAFLFLPYNKANHFNDFEYGALASIAYLKERSSLSKTLLIQIKSFKDIQVSNLVSLSELYTTFNLDDLGLQIAKEEDSPDFAEFFFLSAQGKTEEIEQWVQAHPNVEKYTLISAAEIALKNHPKIGLKLAHLLTSRYPSDQHLIFLSKAHVVNGNVTEALQTLSQVKSHGFEVIKGHIFALAVGAKNFPSHEYEEMLSENISKALAYQSVSLQDLRDIGYLIADNGHKSMAEPIFFALSDQDFFNRSDLKTLIGLWGKEIDSKKMDWIKDKLANEEIEKKASWLSYFNSLAQYQLVLSFINRDELTDEGIVDPYLEALIFQKEEKRLQDEIAYLIPQESRLPRVKKFGQLAEQEGLLKIAKLLYNQAITIDPTDAPILKRLGLINFSTGNMSCALGFLNKYLFYGNADYEVFYALGEVLYFYDLPQASLYFCLSLQELHKPVSEEKRRVQAKIYQRFGLYRKAIALYETLIKSNPDPYLYADFVNLLIDDDRRHSAAYFLNNYSGKKSLALDIAKVRLFSESNHMKQAYLCSNHLLMHHHDEAEVFASRSDLEFKSGRQRQAEYFIEKAICLEEENGYYKKALGLMREKYHSWWDINWEYRKTQDEQKEYFWDFSAYSMLGNHLSMLIEIETDHIILDNFQSITDGLTVSVDTTKYRSFLTFAYDTFSGATWKGALYLGEDLFGFGSEVKYVDYFGSYGFVFEYHKPNWDFTQTVIENGSRDLIGVFRFLRLTPQLESSIGYAFNIYNLEGFSMGALSHSIEFNLTYNIPKFLLPNCFFKHEDFVTANYYLDAEYDISTRKKEGVFGEFAPIPLESRETHSFFLNFHQEYRKFWNLEGFAGYTIDRYGSITMMSPIYGASVYVANRRNWEWKFLYSHTASTQDTATVVDRFRVELKYVY